MHPELGTIEDFDDFVAAAADLGLEVALDLALQCAPDHPWAQDHRQWFTELPDGTIAYAENPPKKYQDIYPLNFDNDPVGLYVEVLRVVRHWVDHGVKIFRVDNPHTKPPDFWAWLIGRVKSIDPDVLFLAEAFTRPARLYGLAKLGFTQSYSYFTWRTAKWELTEFGQEIAAHADEARPNLFVNTPDILHESLQHGGPGMFAIRAALASTLSPLWGVYSGYELFEHQPVRAGSEEYLDSEKYELRPRDFEAALAQGRSLEPFMTQLNEIRRLHPALREMRTIKFHAIDNDALLAYSKFDPDDRRLRAGGGDPQRVRPRGGHAVARHGRPRYGVVRPVLGTRRDHRRGIPVGPSELRPHRPRQGGCPHPQHAAAFPSSPARRCCAASERSAPMTSTGAVSRYLAPDPSDLHRLIAGTHHDPHAILGAHEYGDQTVIRAFRPHAEVVTALVGGERYPLQHIDSGLFAVALPFVDLVDYRLEIGYPTPDGGTFGPTVADAYRFLPTLGEVDLHLFAEGRHERLWEVLGAHPRSFSTPDGVVDGVSFAVWAPNAKGVSLIGEFNRWDGNEAPLRVLGSTGVWELFWPGFPADGLYKFRIHGADGSVSDRADPMAFATEVPPHTASRVTSSNHVWGDADWMTQRGRQEPGVRADEHLRGAPRVVATRAVLPAAGRRAHRIRCGPGLHPRRDAARGRAPVRRLMGLSGHVVLRAQRRGSAAPDDFRYLVDPLHQAGIGVHRRLGARPLPQGRLGAGPLRRHPALRARRPAPRRATRLGHLRFRLRPQRGTQLPGGQRAVLAAGVPHRRPAGRRRGVDALPGLLAARRTAGRRTSTAAGRTSRRCSSCRR